jgi:hypothetical protein
MRFVVLSNFLLHVLLLIHCQLIQLPLAFTIDNAHRLFYAKVQLAMRSVNYFTVFIMMFDILRNSSIDSVIRRLKIHRPISRRALFEHFNDLSASIGPV